MKTYKTTLNGVLLIEPDCFQDERGFFLESFQEKRYRDIGIQEHFVQENHSRSNKNVLRGMHFQISKPQAQIVTVIRGLIYDVCIDLRSDSNTYGQWFGTELGDNGLRQIYMASGFAHGFFVLSDCADLHYKVSQFYDSNDEGGLIWNDPNVGVKWPVKKPIISSRDSLHPTLLDLSIKNS